MNRLLAMVAIAICTASAHAAPCSRAASVEAQSMLHEFAQWRTEGDHLAVHWIYKIELRPEIERLKMVATYANMDACLAGGAREILFYRNNKLMAIASPASGVRLIK